MTTQEYFKVLPDLEVGKPRKVNHTLNHDLAVRTDNESGLFYITALLEFQEPNKNSLTEADIKISHYYGTQEGIEEALKLESYLGSDDLLSYIKYMELMEHPDTRIQVVEVDSGKWAIAKVRYTCGDGLEEQPVPTSYDVVCDQTWGRPEDLYQSILKDGWVQKNVYTIPLSYLSADKIEVHKTEDGWTFYREVLSEVNDFQGNKVQVKGTFDGTSNIYETEQEAQDSLSECFKLLRAE